MAKEPVVVTGGIDTHLDFNVGAVIDQTTRVLGTETFSTDARGNRALQKWLLGFGALDQVGIEGTGSYGAGISTHLTAAGIKVVEVNRPDRALRRKRHGKTDFVDAEAAARAALSGEATASPKPKDGIVEAIRVVQVARRSAVKQRTATINQITNMIVTAPQTLRAELEPLNATARVKKCAGFRTGVDMADPLTATKAVLRRLAHRFQTLTTEIEAADSELAQLTVATNPALVGAKGVGPEVAAALLVVIGQNPERVTSESALAALCGASPVQASSGKNKRHRVNLGGNRHGNAALWRIAFIRRSSDPRTIAYVERKRTEKKNDKEIMRCLMRYIAREIYQLVTNPPNIPDNQQLRTDRKTLDITLAQAAEALTSHATQLSKLERGTRPDNDLAHRYRTWLNQQQNS